MLALVRGAFCPSCVRLLYTLSREDGSRDWVHSGTPLQEDAQGHFMTCRVCGRRVGMRRSSGLPGWGYEVER